jgi:4-diphosphocytidyl-2-C-methyl-D-erythritol kinase
MLDSLFMPVALHDVVTVKPAMQLTLTQSGAFANTLPDQENNIATKAAKALAKKAGVAPDVAIHIEKNIPIGAGMAGGSADAAATLRALNKLWKLEYSLETLAELGLTLGADVPYCLYQTPAFVSGIGENISPITHFPKLHVVLVNPRVAVDTPTVFRHGVGVFSGEVAKPALTNAPYQEWLEFLMPLQNDLTENACLQAPAITEILAMLSSYAEVNLARMSGSGATCFALVSNQNQAQALAKKINQHCPKWFVSV